MPSNKPSIAEDWYRLSFASLYPVVYAHRTVESAREEASFSVLQTPIQKTDVVLDLCCGNGRHMAHLIGCAGRVVGLDYSEHLLAIAHATLSPADKLVRADMRHPPFASVFDVVVNYFTSFGYFISDDENLLVVQGMANALKKDGRFFIDYLNRAWAEKHLEPNSVRHHDGYEIREDRWIDEQSFRINKKTTVIKDGQQISELGESVKLYSLEEITDLLARGGLVVEKTFGDYTGTDCCDASKPRMILVGRKA